MLENTACERMTCDNTMQKWTLLRKRGIPGCPLCSNPRRSHKNTLTAQEKRVYQDTEKTTDKHSNGLLKKDDIE